MSVTFTLYLSEITVLNLLQRHAGPRRTLLLVGSMTRVSSRCWAISGVVSRANFACAVKTTGASGRNVGRRVSLLLKLVYRSLFCKILHVRALYVHVYTLIKKCFFNNAIFTEVSVNTCVTVVFLSITIWYSRTSNYLFSCFISVPFHFYYCITLLIIINPRCACAQRGL